MPATALRSTAPSVAHAPVEGLAAVVLRAGSLAATFVPVAGMVGTSVRHDGEELLDRGAGLRAYAATGATMGIPFLHPWANRLDAAEYAAGGRTVTVPGGLPHDEQGTPIHGVLPRSWDLRRTGADARGAWLEAALDFPGHPAFPFPHHVAQHVRLRHDGLHVRTTVRADRGAALPVAFGFHPYLRLPGVPRPAWELTLPARRRLCTDDRLVPDGQAVREPAERAPLGARTLDVGYDALSPCAVLAIAGGGRRLEVRLVAGYPAAQVYAPGARDVVCLEPMTAPANALATGDGLRVLAPGASLAAVFELRVQEA